MQDKYRRARRATQRPTRWPFFQPAMPAPSSSMTPAISCPGTRGYLIPGHPPSFVKRVAMTDSAGLHANYDVAGWREGISRSTTSNSAPGALTWTTFILGMGAPLLKRLFARRWMRSVVLALEVYAVKSSQGTGPLWKYLIFANTPVNQGSASHDAVHPASLLD